jgi:hypothetical protein
MARFEMADLESAVLGQAPATADSFYQLGIQYSVGSDVATDLVSAHKGFNLDHISLPKPAGTSDEVYAIAKRSIVGCLDGSALSGRMLGPSVQCVAENSVLGPTLRRLDPIIEVRAE